MPHLPEDDPRGEQRTPLGVLREVFGFDRFRGQQLQIIEHVIAGGDAVVLMPTGGGKSLCYQVPALVRAGLGVSLVPSSAERMRVPGLHFHHVDAPLASWRIGVAWHRGSVRHNLISRFVEIIRAVIGTRGLTAI